MYTLKLVVLRPSRKRSVEKNVDFAVELCLRGIIRFSIYGAEFNLVEPGSGNIISTPGEYNVVFSNGVSFSASLNVTLYGEQVTIEEFPTL